MPVTDPLRGGSAAMNRKQAGTGTLPYLPYTILFQRIPCVKFFHYRRPALLLVFIFFLYLCSAADFSNSSMEIGWSYSFCPL